MKMLTLIAGNGSNVEESELLPLNQPIDAAIVANAVDFMHQRQGYERFAFVYGDMQMAKFSTAKDAIAFAQTKLIKEI